MSPSRRSLVPCGNCLLLWHAISSADVGSPRRSISYSSRSPSNSDCRSDLLSSMWCPMADLTVSSSSHSHNRSCFSSAAVMLWVMPVRRGMHHVPSRLMSVTRDTPALVSTSLAFSHSVHGAKPLCLSVLPSAARSSALMLCRGSGVCG
eukprot:3222290-Rhodomonas_salina.2